MTPRSYQIAGAEFLAARRCALLADQMRVGKTPQAIMAADKIGAERVLVLCPAIARYQWAQQWADWSNRSPATILDANLTRPWDEAGILISSYNRAVASKALLRASKPWDLVIVDEAHFSKTPTAQRTSLVYGKSGIGWHSGRMWALTGTPAPNHAGEMWPMLRAFGVTKCTYDEFVRYFCIYDEKRGMFHGNQKRHLDELRALIAPVVLRRTLAQVAPQMPKIGYNFFVVRPETDADYSTDNEAAISEMDRIAVAMAKVPSLAEEIEHNLQAQEYAQTVVFGYHVDPLKALVAELNQRGIDAATLTGRDSDRRKQDTLAMFKAGALQVTVAQIIAAGTAVDLSAASHGYFLELDFVPDNNAQAAHRLVNLQTQTPVTFDVLTWPGTQDDKVQRRVIRKVETAVFKS